MIQEKNVLRNERHESKQEIWKASTGPINKKERKVGRICRSAVAGNSASCIHALSDG